MPHIEGHKSQAKGLAKVDKLFLASPCFEFNLIFELLRSPWPATNIQYKQIFEREV